MKVLFCKSCRDFVKLIDAKRACACGQSRGRTIGNISHYSGNAISLELQEHVIDHLLEMHVDESAIIIQSKEINSVDREFCTKVIEYLNQAAGTDFSTKYPSANATLIIQRRNETLRTVDEFKNVIDKKVRQWKGTEFEQYLRPATLFNKTKFQNYLGEISNVKQSTTNKTDKFTKFVGTVYESQKPVHDSDNETGQQP